MKNKDKKIIVILGPTASGKSELAVKVALRFNSGQAKKRFGINGGEIISADSRQVYKGMDIGTGKVTKKEMQGIPHHLLDVANPKRTFNVFQYRKLALKAINNIFKRGKVPILCGGTGFYIQTVIDGIKLPEVKPDWKLRKRLEKKSTAELYKILKKIDSKRAKTIDRKNPRRLIRAIEIVTKTKKPVPAFQKNPLPYPVLIIGVKKSPAELKKLIKKRLLKRLKNGMVTEVKKLHKDGVSWKRLEEFGLEYFWLSRYLQKKITYKKMIEKLQKDTEHFSKRQMTWFSAHGGSASGEKRNKKIKWVKNYKETDKLAKGFLNK